MALPVFSIALQEVQLALVGISVRPASQYQTCLEVLHKLAAAQKIEPAELRCSINADPLGTFLNHQFSASNATVTGIEDNSEYAQKDADKKSALADALGHMANLAKTSARSLPMTTSVLVDTAVHHNAGASCVEELHAALATGVLYLETLLDTGLEVESACEQIVFQVALDADLLLGAAKLRALRALWQHTVQQLTGKVDAPASTTIVAETSSRYLSTMQPWNNHLRNLSASTAALLGGADTLIVHPHDLLGRYAGQTSQADEVLSDRMARNIAIILERECGLYKVSDPLAGSYAVENLTQQLISYTWKSLEDTDTANGWLDELITGRWQSRLTDTHRRRTTLMQNQQHIAVGVNRFVQDGDAHHATQNLAPVPPLGTPLGPPSAPALTPVRDAAPFEPQAPEQDKPQEALKASQQGNQTTNQQASQQEKR